MTLSKYTALWSYSSTILTSSPVLNFKSKHFVNRDVMLHTASWLKKKKTEIKKNSFRSLAYVKKKIIVFFTENVIEDRIHKPFFVLFSRIFFI